MTLASPNQEIAFVFAAGYTAISVLTCGLIVAYPNISDTMAWLQYISMMKYPYQAILLQFFNNNANAIGPFGMTIESIVERLEFNTPSTVWENIGASLAIYCLFIVCGFICLKYLHKENR